MTLIGLALDISGLVINKQAILSDWKGKYCWLSSKDESLLRLSKVCFPSSIWLIKLSHWGHVFLNEKIRLGKPETAFNFFENCCFILWWLKRLKEDGETHFTIADCHCYPCMLTKWSWFFWSGYCKTWKMTVVQWGFQAPNIKFCAEKPTGFFCWKANW